MLKLSILDSLWVLERGENSLVGSLERRNTTLYKLIPFFRTRTGFLYAASVTAVQKLFNDLQV